jgi:hypothetical protein
MSSLHRPLRRINLAQVRPLHSQSLDPEVAAVSTTAAVEIAVIEVAALTGQTIPTITTMVVLEGAKSPSWSTTNPELLDQERPTTMVGVRTKITTTAHLTVVGVAAKRAPNNNTIPVEKVGAADHESNKIVKIMLTSLAKKSVA